ncbi:hypothetical protein Tco_0098638 [Tanacetum coccineum]
MSDYIPFEIQAEIIKRLPVKSVVQCRGRFRTHRINSRLKVYGDAGLFEYYKEGEKRFCDVWIMKEGATKSFTKMLSIEAPDTWMSYRVLELRKNGEAIIENIDDTITNYSFVLEVYDPSSGRRISGLGINGYPTRFNGWLKTQNRMSKWISIADFECVFCKLEKHSLKKSVECVTGLLIGALVYDLWQERNSRFRPLGLNLMASKQVKEAFEIWVFKVQFGKVFLELYSFADDTAWLHNVISWVDVLRRRRNEMVFGSGVFFVVALVSMECFKNLCSTVGSCFIGAFLIYVLYVPVVVYFPFLFMCLLLPCLCLYASMFYVCLYVLCPLVLLPSRRGVTVYIPPPPYPAPEGLGMVVVAVGYCFIGSGDTACAGYNDGRKATSVEVEMMIEARRKLVEICEEFGPKDVFGNDVFGIIVDDLGLGRMKEKTLAACFPKMSIGEKLEVTKVKMEEDEFYSPRATEVRAASHGVRKSLSGKPDFQHHPTMAHALWVSDSVNLPFELLTSEARRGGSNASTNSPLGKHSTVQHHMNLVQAPTHEENAHMPKPDHKTWTVPSTNDCMNKVLTCQTCECVITGCMVLSFVMLVKARVI